MTEKVRRLQIDVIRDRLERGVEALAGEHHDQSGLRLDHRIPAVDRVEIAEYGPGIGAERGSQVGIELSTRPLPCERGCFIDSTQAVCDHLVAHCPVRPDYFFVEGNMSGDKKASAQSFQSVRGRKVVA